MPTVGWIVEDAIERFWEEQPVAIPAEAHPLRLVCSHCGAVFASTAELRNHYGISHPLGLPALYLHGTPMLKESAIRSQLSAEHIELVQCSECEVQVDGGDWRRLTPEEFKQELHCATSATWNVRLRHRRAEDGASTCEQYHIRLRIPNRESLDDVDDRFLRLLALDELNHDDLARFQATLPQDVASREYGAALGDYALGVLLKERRQPPHSHVKFDEFARRMQAAREVLRDFARPVSIAVCNCIGFNLNDFRRHASAASTEIEPGLLFFEAIIASNPADRSPRHDWQLPAHSRRRAVCPIDEISHRIAAACAESEPLCQATLDSLQALMSGRLPVSEQDIAKIHVLCAHSHLVCNNRRDARPHLLAIQFDPVFRSWAERNLA